VTNGVGVMLTKEWGVLTHFQCASNPFVSTSIYLQILQLPHVNILE